MRHNRLRTHQRRNPSERDARVAQASAATGATCHIHPLQRRAQQNLDERLIGRDARFPLREERERRERSRGSSREKQRHRGENGVSRLVTARLPSVQTPLPHLSLRARVLAERKLTQSISHARQQEVEIELRGRSVPLQRVAHRTVVDATGHSTVCSATHTSTHTAMRDMVSPQ